MRRDPGLGKNILNMKGNSVLRALTIEAGQGTVSFQQKYKNVTVWGFDKINCPKAEIDFEKRTIFVGCTTPLNKMEFYYEISGRILLLPIFGKGPGSITLHDLNETFTFHFEEYEKKNKTHFKVVSTKITMEPGRITFNLENLFNGDTSKVLGDNVLRVMNENWKEVFEDVKASYEDAFGQVFAALFNNLLAKVPVEQIFDN
ncbi:hypothetical protein Zmor_017984 [Zophobas morio]|uniref:Protein takeout n=1 Tax=Zophobas morio TaxID=2755281 RepID=A0AA38MDG4_9CUCU|nr:hypothetical protein Zmor_017984 [Zophobas morio]